MRLSWVGNATAELHMTLIVNFVVVGVGTIRVNIPDKKEHAKLGPDKPQHLSCIVHTYVHGTFQQKFTFDERRTKLTWALGLTTMYSVILMLNVHAGQQTLAM